MTQHEQMPIDVTDPFFESSSYDLYLRELRALPSLSQEQEPLLVERARSGDRQARQALITSCLRYVGYMGTKYAHAFEMDPLEVIAAGNLCLVEILEHALTKKIPCAYLARKAAYGMLDFCLNQRSLISTPEQRSGVPLPAYGVESLSRPLFEDGDLTLGDTLAKPSDVREPETDYSALYEAIGKLTPIQREVVCRRYGLLGYIPQLWREMAEEKNGSREKKYITLHSKNCQHALASLSKHLAPRYASA